MPPAKKSLRAPKPSEAIVECPYCRKKTIIQTPPNYAPVYEKCMICANRFIVERIQDGFDLYKIGEAPSLSDPESRAIEWAGGQEE